LKLENRINRMVPDGKFVEVRKVNTSKPFLDCLEMDIKKWSGSPVPAKKNAYLLSIIYVQHALDTLKTIFLFLLKAGKG